MVLLHAIRHSQVHRSENYQSAQLERHGFFLPCYNYPYSLLYIKRAEFFYSDL
jgi:hypothetical protein